MAERTLEERYECIEGLVERLRGSLEDVGKFDAADGLSAVLTLASRFAKGMLLLSQTEGDKAKNREAIVDMLREMADELEDADTDAWEIRH